ncbi:MAG: hypothetical protein AAFR34_09705 [Pseudomonadota bacterium]
MRRHILAPALALAIALGVAAPRPAQAENGEAIVGVIVGVAALALIAKAIEDNREEEKARTQRATRFHATPNVTRQHRHGHQSRIYNRARILPDQCFRTIETRSGVRQVFGQRCLQRNGVNTARLPGACAYQVRTQRGIRTVYAGRCLRQNGWLRQSVAANR